MDHQSFRFYIPGIIFLFPIYVILCWIIIEHYDNIDLRQFVLIGGIAVFPAISLPVGWFLYNIYRVIWLKLTNGGYENKEFNKLVNRNTKPFFCPLQDAILMDFSNILNENTWLKLEVETFRNTFYPFYSKRKFYNEITKVGLYPKFTEHLSDKIQFEDNSYDYARSISSVRYSLEGSVFALFLGLIYSFAIRSIWLYLLSTTQISYLSYIICLYSIIILSIVLIVILFIRWYLASKEYDARLNLISLISTHNEIDIRIFENNIPSIVLENTRNLFFCKSDYAAFDLDNTLLKGDIGDAVFAELIKRNRIKNFNWNDYCKLIENNREQAYIKVIEVMKGIEVKEIEKITLDIMQSSDDFIELADIKIPIPKPNLKMQAFIAYLRSRKIDILIVTASNQISAQLICWRYFGIPSSDVFGGKVRIDRRGKVKELLNKIPFANEKANILKNIKKSKPMITGGDGIWDKYLIDYTTKKGIRLWLGKDNNEYFKLKNDSFKDLIFLHVKD